ncbi:MAG: FecR domain-containing protein [Bacteroidales bacterium]|nr:FecR domain-containing protein [Bacteroidales bacterium]
MNLEWLVRFLTGDLEEKEKKELAEWIKENESNKKKFENIRYLWEKSPGLKAYNEIDVEEGWESVRPHLKSRFKLRAQKLPLSAFLLRVAVLLVFACVMVFGLYKIIHFIPKDDTISVVSSDIIKDVSLPDGTWITLNKYSQITYDKRFNKNNREVFFSGEAYFDVIRGQRLPFIIRTGNSTIQVVGTSFNIKDDSSSLTVTVISGKVWLYETANRENRVRLAKNETASFDYATKKIIYGENSDLNFLSWKTGSFEFVKTPTVDVLNTIASYYNKKLILNIPVHDSITGVFDNQPLDEILKEIELTSSLKIDNQEDYIIVRK